MKESRYKKFELTPYIMVLPFFLIFVYFYIVPVFKVLLDSFTNYDMFTKREFVAFENYTYMFSDEIFLKSIRNTFVYTICTLVPALALGLGTALLVGSTLIKTKFSRMFIFMPHVLSMVAISMIWLTMYEPINGIFNTILDFLGFQKKQWLMDVNTAMVSLVVMGIWKSTGYYMIVFLSGLKNIPLSYYEAAKIDGSSSFNTFRKITFPLLNSTSSFLFITGVIASFNVFEQVNIMTNGGPMYATTTVVHQIYTKGFTEYKLGYASAMSVFMLVIVVIITAINFKLTRNEEA
ncbi:MAG: carbohydrate ABC transporter permease [Lachnospirales bacterium]